MDYIKKAIKLLVLIILLPGCKTIEPNKKPVNKTTKQHVIDLCREHEKDSGSEKERVAIRNLRWDIQSSVNDCPTNSLNKPNNRLQSNIKTHGKDLK